MSHISNPRAKVLGVEVDAIDLPTAVRAVLDATSGEGKSYACLLGAHSIVESLRDPLLADAYRNAALKLPDGMPTVWFGRWQGFTQMDRVFGPDLMARVFEESQGTGQRHFLYGGLPGVAGDLAQRLLMKFPRAQIVGTYTPPFRKLTCSEEADLAAQIEDCRPDILWVGISSPKQDLFMREYSARLNVRVMVGVGAAFDFHSGRLKDSPNWVKRAGLQWFHRLLQEPRRLWRRYLRTNTLFLWLTVLAVLRLRKFGSNPPSVLSADIRA